MDLSGINGLTDYSGYINSANEASTQALQNRLNNTVSEASSDDELLEACKEFESYLWEQVFKEMEKTAKVFSDDEDKDGYASNMVDYFKDSVIQEISNQATNQGANSVAQMLYEQMKRNYNIE